MGRVVAIVKSTISFGVRATACGTTKTELARAEEVVCRRWELQDGTGAPDDPATARGLRREEQALHDVAETVLRRRADRVGLMDDRDDRSRDDVPVLRDRDRNDRLHVDQVAKPLAPLTGAPFEVALEWNADERRDRVLQLLGEFGGILTRCRRLIFGEGRAREEDADEDREGERRQPPHGP